MGFHQAGPHCCYMDHEPVSDRPVLGYIRGENFSFAVDTGASKRHVAKFYTTLRQNGLPLPSLTGISHYHWDHAYGAAYVAGMTIASDKCNEILLKESGYVWTTEEMKKRWEDGVDIKFSYFSKLAEYDDVSEIRVVPADVVIRSDTTVDLGGVHVEVIYCGGPHSDDHLMFYVPEDRFLFLSDASGKELFTLDWDYDEKHPELIQDYITPLPYNPVKLKPFVERLEKLDFERCILGHMDDMMTREDLLAELKSHL